MKKSNSRYYHANIAVNSIPLGECLDLVDCMESDWSNYSGSWNDWNDCKEGYFSKAAQRKIDALNARHDRLHRAKHPELWAMVDGVWEMHC